MDWGLRRRLVGRFIQVDILFDSFFIREFRAFQHEGLSPSRWIGHKHIIAAGIQDKAMFLAGLAASNLFLRPRGVNDDLGQRTDIFSGQPGMDQEFTPPALA